MNCLCVCWRNIRCEEDCYAKLGSELCAGHLWILPIHSLPIKHGLHSLLVGLESYLPTSFLLSPYSLTVLWTHASWMFFPIYVCKFVKWSGMNKVCSFPSHCLCLSLLSAGKSSRWRKIPCIECLQGQLLSRTCLVIFVCNSLASKLNDHVLVGVSLPNLYMHTCHLCLQLTCFKYIFSSQFHVL